MNYPLAYAYALGYYDGRSKGVEDNQFTFDDERQAYTEGYERGVTDYCELDEEAA
jgi:hypothetical protein